MKDNELITPFEEAEPETESSSRTKKIVIAIFAAALILANLYLMGRVNRVQVEAETSKKLLTEQVARLRQAALQTRGETERRMEEVRAEVEQARRQAQEKAVREAREQAARVSKTVGAQQQRHQELLLGELRTVQDSSQQTGRRVAEVEQEVGQLESETGVMRSELQEASLVLNETQGRLESVARRLDENSEGLESLRSRLQREPVQFAVSRSGQFQRVGGVALRLKKTRPKRNTYSLEVLAGEKMFLRKRWPVNQPLEFYVGGLSSPYELVVTEVEQDRVRGYLLRPAAPAMESTMESRL